jgi:hypothetical protein
VSVVCYHIYINGGSGGPVDYGSPFATICTSGVSYAWGSPVTGGLGTFSPVLGGMGSEPAGPTLLATAFSFTQTLAAPSDWTFAIRAFYEDSGLEEQNLDARVRVHVGPTGIDLAGLPAPPTGLTLTPLPGGGLRAHWAYTAVGRGMSPEDFHVYFGSPTPDTSAPAVIAPYTGRSTYAADFPALTPGQTYQVVVRAHNATGESADAGPVSFTIPAEAPSAPLCLSAVAVP